MVNAIVEQVLAALRQRDVGVASGAAVPAGGASSRPAPAQASAGGKNHIASLRDPKTLARVFLTADVIEQRIRSADKGGVVELAYNEILTPNALDLIDRRRMTVHKAAKPSAQPLPAAQPNNPDSVRATAATCPTGSAAGRSLSIGLVIERPNEKTRSALGPLARDEISLVDYNRTDCSIRNLQSLCEAVASGAVAAGVVIAPYAADAMMLANKVNGVRAVQGTRRESVSAAVRRFGANLLVLEHAFSTYHEIRTMIRVFAQRDGAPTNVALLDALKTLERS